MVTNIAGLQMQNNVNVINQLSKRIIIDQLSGKSMVIAVCIDMIDK